MSIPTLEGCRVLIVEDESLIAMLLEDILDGLGCTAAAQANHIDHAHTLAEAEEIDAAIVDVNLGGHSSLPVAERLIARGVPVVFTTGYGAQGVPEKLRRWPTVEKPFRMAEVKTALQQALTIARA